MNSTPQSRGKPPVDRRLPPDRHRRRRRRLLQAAATRRLNLSCLGSAALLEQAIEQAAGLRSVNELDCSSNTLEALPPSVAARFGGTICLLRCKYNRLTALPAELVQLPRLAHLDLEGNQIATLDDAALLQLTALQSLSLSSCGLARLPECLSACRGLKELHASNNPLTELPDSLGDCPALALIDVSSCRLATLPPSLARLKSLQRLYCQVHLLLDGCFN